MAFDYSKLSGRIVEKYGTRRAFAAAAGFSEPALSARLNNLVPFKADEIKKICAPGLLDIPDQEVTDYFFKVEVR
jgi:hypothetical protein